MKTGKAPGPLEVSLELAAVGVGVGIQVMAEIFHRDLDGFRMPVELALSIVIPIFKRKCNNRNCSCDKAVKLLGHGLNVVKVVEWVLGKGLRE